MFSGVTSSARSPSHTKMMTLRAAGPPGCGAAGAPASPSTTNDKALEKMSRPIFMAVLVSSLQGGHSPRRAIRPALSSVAGRGTKPPSGLEPVGDEHVLLARRAGVAVGGEDQALAVAREHRKRRERVRPGDALESGPVEVHEVEGEGAAARIVDVRREDDLL